MDCVVLFGSAAVGGGGGADGNVVVVVDVRESLYIFFRSPMLLAPNLNLSVFAHFRQSVQTLLPCGRVCLCTFRRLSLMVKW